MWFVDCVCGKFKGCKDAQDEHNTEKYSRHGTKLQRLKQVSEHPSSFSSLRKSMNIRSLMMRQPGRDELYSIMIEKLQKLLLQREGSNTHRNSKFRGNDEVQYLRYN